MSEEEAKRLFEEKYGSDSHFAESYLGEYDNLKEYAHAHVDGWYDIDFWLESCINWERVCELLRVDRTIIHGGEGTIYVFRE